MKFQVPLLALAICLNPALWFTFFFFCHRGMHIHARINIHANHGYVTFKHSRAQS